MISEVTDFMAARRQILSGPRSRNVLNDTIFYSELNEVIHCFCILFFDLAFDIFG